MNYRDLYISQLNRHYCNAKELQYSAIYNYFLDLDEINQFYDFIEKIMPDYKQTEKMLDYQFSNILSDN